MQKKSNYSWFLIALIMIVNIIVFSIVIKHLEKYFKGVKEDKAAQYKATLNE
jgi:ABC-type cobalt transport system substrate-binding protein